MERTKEEKDRRLLNLEIVLIVTVVAINLSAALIVSFVNMELWQRIVIVSVGVALSIPLVIIGIKIEQVAGYYVCKLCGHKHVPTFGQVSLSFHLGRTRYIKCPECHKCSWQKKVVK